MSQSTMCVRDEFLSVDEVEEYFKAKISSLEEVWVKLIINMLEDLGKLPRGSKSGRLLDIGCGSGVLTSLIGEHFEHVIGIDLSATQIEKANATIHLDHVEFKVATAESLPVKDNSIDVITAIFAAQNFEIGSFVQECRRVLKPNGVVLFYSDFLTTLASLEHNSLPVIVEEIKEMKDKCMAIAQSSLHPVRYILDNSQALYELMDWKNKLKLSQTAEIVCNLSDVLKYYRSIPFYATEGNPMVKLFQEIKRIWDMKEGEENLERVRASFQATFIILQQ